MLNPKMKHCCRRLHIVYLINVGKVQTIWSVKSGPKSPNFISEQNLHHIIV